jgi:DNA polymerase III subunit delta
VFCHKNKSLDKRRELGKKIDQYAVTLNTKKMYENQLPEFVREYTQDKKISIDDRAILVLCESVGNDLHRLTNEIDKLTISLPAGTGISVDQVMNQVGISKEYNIFELQKAILNRDTLTATRIVNYYVSNTKKNPIIPAVAYLYSFFSKLLMATQVTDKSEKGIASELKMSPYAARDYTLALRQYHPQKIMDNISSLKEADLKLKGVNVVSSEDGQTFRELIWRLMN